MNKIIKIIIIMMKMMMMVVANSYSNLITINNIKLIKIKENRKKNYPK